MPATAMLLALLALLAPLALLARAQPWPAALGFHNVSLSDAGELEPWLDPVTVLNTEMSFFYKCPSVRGWPVFLSNTFMNGQYEITGLDILVGMVDGMGILSYVKYYRYTNRTATQALALAETMAAFILQEALTKPTGAWPSFPRSTGIPGDWPIFCAAQGDLVFGCDTIEPDKAGIVGHALLELYDESPQGAYLNASIWIATVLQRNLVRQADATRSPWPFRVDANSGFAYSPISSNMVFILRMLDGLVDKHGQTQFADMRASVLSWMLDYQIPSPTAANASLWVQFFEDKLSETDRVSWSPIATARYLCERREAVDANWQVHAEQLLRFALNTFSSLSLFNTTLMGEQDATHTPYGGATTNFFAGAALFAAATGSSEFRAYAQQGLTWWTYFVDSDGCPTDDESGHNPWSMPSRGGWMEDCHTDVVHSIVDVLTSLAVPWHA